MKSFAFISLVFCSLSVFASMDSLPLQEITTKKLTKEEFNSTLLLLEKKFGPLAAQNNRTLEFMGDYDSDWAQAFARRWETDQIIVYGGIAGINGMTVDVLVLTLCHELGHLYGGEPYGNVPDRMAVEGQADYWATNVCFPEVINDRERAISAALVLTAFLAEGSNLPAPRIETPDTSEAIGTLRTHPLPQCRLDTMLAGISNQERPRCWYRGITSSIAE